MVHGRAFQCVLLFAVAGFFLLLLADWQGAYSFVSAFGENLDSFESKAEPAKRVLEGIFSKKVELRSELS